MAMQGGPMMPPKPPTPGETGPEAERQQMQYDHWLMKHSEALEGHIKFLEQQIQKQKRTKKAINSRNRQAKKNGQELSPQDQMELDRASQEQSVLQKQLESVRKQNRQHQISIQEFRAKQQERFNQHLAQQGPQPVPGGLPLSGPSAMSTPGMQPPPPRIPGVQGSARLRPSQRLEYEQYMQSRLQQMGQGMPPRGVPRPPGMPQQPRMAIVDNNPFSDTYQQRELQSSQPKPVGAKPDEGTEPPFRFPQAQVEGQPWMPQRFPYDPAGQRMPGPDQRFPGPFPPPQQQPPSTFEQTTEVNPAASLDAVTNIEQKEKVKKRKKKKKPPENAPTPATQAPPGKLPPVTFKPQDETERRIMEILNSTANMQRAQSPATTTATTASTITTATTTTKVSVTQPMMSQPDTQPIVTTGQVINPPTTSPGNGQTPIPVVKTPPVPGTQTADTTPGLEERPPSQPGTVPSPLTTVSTVSTQPLTIPSSLAVSDTHMSDPSISSTLPVTQPPPGLQTMPNRPRLPGMPPGISSPGMTGGLPVGFPQRHQLPPGQHPVHGQPNMFQGQQRPYAGYPPHVRQMHPEMSPQMQQQLQRFPRFEHMPSHSMQQRPPVLPHWVAPGTTVPNSTQARRSPRPSVPGVNTMVRMGIPRHRFPSHDPNQPGVFNPNVSQQGHIQGNVYMHDQVRPGIPQVATESPTTTVPPATTVPTNAEKSGDVRSQDITRSPNIPSPRLSGTDIISGRETGAPDRTLSGTEVKPEGIQKDSEKPPANTQSEPAQGSYGIPVGKPSDSIGSEKMTIEGSQSTDKQGQSGESVIQSDKSPPDKCDDGIHCGTPPPGECTDGIHCGTPPPGECTDGIHCGTPPPGECTDGIHCGTPPPGECTDGIHCGTPPPGECTDGIHCGTPPPGECTDGIHCGTPPPGECTDGIHCGTPPPGECTDGIHCGTPPPGECTDGIHCGTPPPGECTDGIYCGTPPPGECTDGIHCGTPPPGEYTDGIHCGTPPPGECTDGIHCGTPPPGECTDGIHCGTPPPGECTDGIHCGTPPPGECTDGIHCGTPPPGECTDGIHCGTPPPGECTDGIHCGTPPPGECTDGIHCGTPPPGECTDGIHCGTPPPGECTDGIHCGTPPPGECTDGIHCGTPPPGECTDGIHCGTPPPGECTDGIHCGTPPPGECTDGIHCGTPPPGECTDGIHCGTPPPGECTDGIHCGTPPPGECTDGIHCGTPPPGECTDGIHCGTPPPGECTDGIHCGTPPPGECTDGIHCGTPPPGECTDGIHCGTPPPGECTDGIHCGTPPPGECTDGIHCGTPPPGECTDGIHCGTPPPGECTDGIHCGTPPPGECTDGIHCGTPPPGECTDGIHCGTPPPGECTDGIHCGTPPPGECTDGIHCGTPPPGECTDGIHCGTPPPGECTDGIHCGTPPPGECTDGIHCGTPPPGECTDGIHCGTPPPGECTDGIHCGTPPPGECTDGIHCGTPPPGECTDGIHCGTPPPGECTDWIHCGTPPPGECTDGIHCGTPPPGECTDGIHCGTPPPGECTDGIHCGTPPPGECTDGIHCGTPPPGECTDGIHCGTPPPGECTDGIHCGTPPPGPSTDGKEEEGGSSLQTSAETSSNVPSESLGHQEPSCDNSLPVNQSTLPQTEERNEPSQSMRTLNVEVDQHSQPSRTTDSNLLSPQQLAVQADHQYVNTLIQPAAVKQKPPDLGQDTENSNREPSISSSNVTISSHNSAFVPPNTHSTEGLSTDMKPSIPTISSESLSSSQTSNTQSVPSQLSSEQVHIESKTNPQSSISSSQSNIAGPPVSINPVKQPVPPPSSVPVENVPQPSMSDQLKSVQPAQMTTETKVTTFDVRPEGQGILRPEMIKAENTVSADMVKDVKIETTSDPNKISEPSVPVTHLNTGAMTDPRLIDKKPDSVSSVVSTEPPPVPNTSGAAPGSQVPITLTTVPRPQYFGPIQRFPGDRAMNPNENRFPMASRPPLPPGHPENFARYPRMETRGQYPGHPQGHPQQAPYQHGMPRHFQHHEGQEPSDNLPRPGHTDVRPWRHGLDTRLRLPVQPPRMTLPTEVSKPGETLPLPHNQRYTLQGPEFPGQHGQHIRPFPGQRPELRMSTSPSSSQPYESRYQLQHPSPDPRYTFPGQHAMRPQRSRFPGQMMPGQGQPEMRHAYPGQVGPYFHQRHPSMQRFMRPEHMMMQHREPAPQLLEHVSRSTPDSQLGQKPPMVDSKEGMKLITTVSVNQPANVQGVPTISPAQDATVSNIKVEPQAQTQGSTLPAMSTQGVHSPASQRSGTQPSPAPSGGSQRSTPQNVPSPAMSGGSQGVPVQSHSSPSAASHRSSPAQSQSPGRSAVSSPHDDLPSVSATFAAAGMMRLGEKNPYIGSPMSNVSSASSGFSSVSSIVQSVSTVSFPVLAGHSSTQATTVSQTPATEIALPPSTTVKSEALSVTCSGSSAGTQTPIHGGLPATSQPDDQQTKPKDEIPPGVAVSSEPSSVPSTVGVVPPHGAPGPPHMSESTVPQIPPAGPPGPMSHDHMGNPRMFAARPGMPPHTAAAPQQGPRSKGVRQPYGQQTGQRFPNMPSNLPPHLAGMLSGMRGPPMTRQPMYPHQQPERHPGMPMGQMRFPPGHAMAPGGPRPYPVPHPEGIPSSMPSSTGMMMSPTGRHPGMMHPAMHGMRHPGQLRPAAPGGPVGHHMQQLHPGQISPQISPQMSPQMSPTSHPGAPHMHPGIHPPTSGMMAPPGYPELASPTRHPGAPLTPGSVPSTPSPTPSSFSPGMLPPVSGTMPHTSIPGFHGEGPRSQYPYHRFPGHRMPYDPRMQYEHGSHVGPEMHRPMGPIPRFHGDPQQQPVMRGKLAPSGNVASIPAEEVARQMAMVAQHRSAMVTTPPMPRTASATPPLSGSDTRPSSTSSLPAIKQEPESELPPGLDPAHNALLKQLLAKNNAAAMAAAMASGQTTPQSDHSEDSNDFNTLQLTPEQQRQLELIEKMPLTTKRTLPDPELIPDISDPDLEVKRQEYERRRKEMEESRKMKRKNPDGTPKKRKKKKDSTEMAMKQPVMGMGPFQPLGPYEANAPVDKPPMFPESTSPLQSPEKEKKKQRIRKTKKDKGGLDMENIENIYETFSQQLKQLPPVPLMEPFVGHSYAICTLAGASANINGESLVSGAFGKTNLQTQSSDYYKDLMNGITPTVQLPTPKEFTLQDGKQEITDDVRFKLEDGQSDRGLKLPSPFGLGSLGMPRGIMPALPPHPRVEPRIHIPKAGDSPESVISSSSPEVGFGEQDNVDYPMLRPIDPPADEEDTRTSPTMPLLQPIPVKFPPFLLKQETKPEADKPVIEQKDAPIPTHKGKQELDMALLGLAGKDRGGEIDPLTGLPRSSKDASADTEVSVTLTLSAKAAEDIGGVLSAIADLLKIAAPPSYEVSRSPSPEQFKANLKHKEEALNINSLQKMRSTYCKNCDVAFVNTGISKHKSELPNLTREELESDDDLITFCSQHCFMQFKNNRLLSSKSDDTETSDSSSQYKSGIKELGMLSPGEITPSSSMTTTPAATPSSGLEPMEITPTKSGPPTPLLGSPTSLFRKSEFGKSKFRRSSSITEFRPQVKKWKDIKYRRFDHSYFAVFHTVEKKSAEDENWTKLTMSITHDKEKVEDKRPCEFCHQKGDGASDGVARLLNMDIDKWAHLNCALWSQDVYETLNGALMNVQQAYKRALKQKCVLCLKVGASLQCFKSRCNNVYHVPCAQLVGCTFFEDKTIYCPAHSQKGAIQEQVLKSLVVYRKVYINRDEDAQVANMYLQEDGQHTLRIGSVVLHTIGQLLPHQMAGGKFNNRDYLYPVGYKCTRFYWSMKTLYKRCRYICTIQENEGRPEFLVTVKEEGQEDLILQHSSCTGVWKYILEPLETLHKEADLVKIFPTFTSGEELYGLNDPNIIRLIESLPGTDLLKDYVFKFGRRQLIDLPLTINPTGCARTEPKLRTHFRKPHTLQSSSTHSLPSTVTGLTGDLNSPYMKHFVHSKSQQYRRLKTEWKNLVYLGRSRIQGLGLYAAKDLEMHTMVIEYIGDLIRNEVANHREKIYEDQNRGVYMFRIDNDTVVDATMAGGPARYINHSCDPNCVAEVVEIDKESKIIIITNRRIQKGEEFCYDYHFDEEDKTKKIPCACGAWNCRKWMN